jgi:hypothetical protein
MDLHAQDSFVRDYCHLLIGFGLWLDLLGYILGFEAPRVYRYTSDV